MHWRDDGAYNLFSGIFGSQVSFTVALDILMVLR